LDDISFSFTEPEAFADIKKRMEIEYAQRDSYISQICGAMREKMESLNIKGDIYGRFKHLYSIYKKMRRQQKDLSEIFDLCAVRVIVDTVKDCYGVLGLVHTQWRPIPGRFKDYIAMPKQNMYQSIHTTVIGDDGNPFEVQIRTDEMHQIAEYGIAAHWRYKEGKSSYNDFDKKMEWLHQMLDLQQDLGDAHEFVESVKMDLFTNNIYVFSPKGDIYELPAGSCAIDFAYRIHTEIGHQCLGAKINRRLMPLDHKLVNGDIVEIMTAKGRGPNRDWLKIVKTQQAKNKIRQWFRKENREENIANGRELLEEECLRSNYDFPSIVKNEKFTEIARRFNYNNTDDIFAALGYGALSVTTVINRICDEFHFEKESASGAPKIIRHSAGKPGSGIWVKGADNILVRFSHCCNPLPGDNIIGYITRGKGISAHRQDCPNIKYYGQHEPDRLIEIGWEQNANGVFQTGIEITAAEREKLTMDIMSVMADTKTIVNGISINTNKKNKIAVANLKIEVKTLMQLDYVLKKIGNIGGVIKVKRI
jgi:GTP pyrophosphokinase